jgi:hypothetical protein
MKLWMGWAVPMVSVAVCWSGCSEPTLVTGEVIGVVTLNGQPLPEVSVLFTPEGGSGKSGPASGAITDGEGRYTLAYTLSNGDNLASPEVKFGAVVGTHVVTLADFKMMNEMLPPPGRVPAKYQETNSTPLQFEVKEGQQTIDLTLEP